LNSKIKNLSYTKEMAAEKDKTNDYELKDYVCANNKLTPFYREKKLHLTIEIYKLRFFEHIVECMTGAVKYNTDPVYEAFTSVEDALLDCGKHKDDDDYPTGEIYNRTMNELTEFRKATLIHMLLMESSIKLHRYSYMKMVTLYQSEKCDFASICTPILIEKGMNIPDWYTK
jgi:hypothetical protein